MKRECLRRTCLGWSFRMYQALWFSRDEHFAGGALAGAYRSVHVAVPDLRRLRAGPVDTAHGLPQRLTVARPDAGPEAPSVAAPAPLLGGPVSLDVLVGGCGARTEEPREYREDQILTLLGRKLPSPAGVAPLQEAEEHAAARVRRRVVEDDAHLVVEAEGGAGETLSAPERLGVSEVHLGDVAHGHLLSELVAQGRQRRGVADSASKRCG